MPREAPDALPYWSTTGSPSAFSYPTRTSPTCPNTDPETAARVTLVDGPLATAVLAGLLLDTVLGWWWADPLAGYVLVGYAAREVNTIFRGQQ